MKESNFSQTYLPHTDTIIPVKINIPEIFSNIKLK